MYKEVILNEKPQEEENKMNLINHPNENRNKKEREKEKIIE